MNECCKEQLEWCINVVKDCRRDIAGVIDIEEPQLVKDVVERLESANRSDLQTIIGATTGGLRRLAQKLDDLSEEGDDLKEENLAGKCRELAEELRALDPIE